VLILQNVDTDELQPGIILGLGRMRWTAALKAFWESKGRNKLLYWHNYWIDVLQALGVGPPKQLGEAVDTKTLEKRPKPRHGSVASAGHPVS